MLIFKDLLALCTFVMQSKLQRNKPYHFNTYEISIKLFPLIICCFLFACSRQKETQQVLPFQNQVSISESAVNINTATAEELAKLPNIGAKIALDIIEHREKFGKFRKPEHLLLVRGISDKRFRAMRNLIKVE